MLIQKIQIENFKSIKKIQLNPKQITVLIGPNSSGKSTILHAMSILKQSLAENSVNKGNFTTRGGLVNLGSFEDIVRNHDTKNTVKIGFEASFDSLESNYPESNVDGSGKMNYVVSIAKSAVVGLDFSFSYGKINADLHIEGQSIKKISLSTPSVTANVSTQGYGSLFPTFNITNADVIPQNTLRFIYDNLSNGNVLSKLISGFHYIPTSRVIDEYSLPLVSTFNDEIIGSEGHRTNLSRLLSYLISNPETTTLISSWLKSLIGKEIQTKTVRSIKEPNTHEVTLEFLRNKIRTSVINEGSGPNQIILMLAVLATSKSSSVIGIEEPEIHLHPKAQSELAKILIEIAMEKNQQIIFTTHSEHILYPLLTSLASKKEKSLTKDKLAIYYFDVDEEYNTFCEDLVIDEYGRIKGGLKGFLEEGVKSLNEYVDALKNSKRSRR